MKNRILVACEESQEVTKAFRNKGFFAYSCDIFPCSGGHPEWHIQDDVLRYLDEDWALVVAFPPCTHLSVSGARWFPEKIKDGRQQAGIDFFMEFTKLKCRYAIENPVGIMSTKWRKPNQYIQPWQFGHPETKKTGLWLSGLPVLVPTDIVTPEYIIGKDGNRYSPTHYMSQWSAGKLGDEDRGRLRSKTFKGIAEAMAEQWSKTLYQKEAD